MAATVIVTRIVPYADNEETSSVTTSVHTLEFDSEEAADAALIGLIAGANVQHGSAHSAVWSDSIR
jgi:hypothetical protein